MVLVNSVGIAMMAGYEFLAIIGHSCVTAMLLFDWRAGSLWLQKQNNVGQKKFL